MSTNRSQDPWEARIHAAAQQFRYPPTPAVDRALRARSRGARALVFVRRGGWALAALGLIIGSLLAVPPVRGALREFLRIGAIGFVSPAAPSSTPSTSASAPLPAALLDLAGATTLEQARAQVDFPIKLPTHPADLQAPSGVYVQDLGGPATVLVWLHPDDPSRVRLSLHALSSPTFAQKVVGEQLVDEVTVNGQNAAWVRGEHMLQFSDANGGTSYRLQRLVSGNVLIWEADGVTYRLETDLPLDEAVRIAESLR